MKQEAPDPVELLDLVAKLTYRPGWSIWIDLEYDRGQDCRGATLIVQAAVLDTNDRSRTIYVRHLFPIPAAAYNRRSWQRWLFEQLALVERHEGAEMLWINGEQPYAPAHGEGWDPYLITELVAEVDRQKTFRDK